MAIFFSVFCELLITWKFVKKLNKGRRVFCNHLLLLFQSLAKLSSNSQEQVHDLSCRFLGKCHSFTNKVFLLIVSSLEGLHYGGRVALDSLLALVLLRAPPSTSGLQKNPNAETRTGAVAEC